MKPVSTLKTMPSSTKVIALLNQALADSLALKLSIKQAHWNVKGENFIALHELFDKVAAAVDEYADQMAERIVQLGGTAEGDVTAVEKRAEVTTYPVRGGNSASHVKALSQLLRALADQTREGIDSTDDLKDTVTSDILTQITGGLDKWRWMVEAHAQ